MENECLHNADMNGVFKHSLNRRSLIEYCNYNSLLVIKCLPVVNCICTFNVPATYLISIVGLII